MTGVVALLLLLLLLVLVLVEGGVRVNRLMAPSQVASMNGQIRKQ